MYGYFLKSSKLSLWPLVIMRILPQSLRAPSSREQVQDRLFLRMHWQFHVVSSPLEELALCFCCFGGTFLLPDVEEGGPSKAIFCICLTRWPGVITSLEPIFILLI